MYLRAFVPTRRSVDGNMVANHDDNRKLQKSHKKVSSKPLTKSMQQGSFRESRLENERKVKKLDKQTAFLRNRQGLRCFRKETIHHGAITKEFSSVIIILFSLL